MWWCWLECTVEINWFVFRPRGRKRKKKTAEKVSECSSVIHELDIQATADRESAQHGRTCREKTRRLDGRLNNSTSTADRLKHYVKNIYSGARSGSRTYRTQTVFV